MYGGEHLLRLLVKLPELLPMTSLPADNYGDQ
jgi:MRG